MNNPFPVSVILLALLRANAITALPATNIDFADSREEDTESSSTFTFELMGEKVAHTFGMFYYDTSNPLPFESVQEGRHAEIAFL